MLNRSTQIRVIFIIYKFTADGSSIALLNLIDGLIQQDVSPLIIMSKKGSLCKELEIRNIHYEVIPYHLSRYYTFNNRIIDIISFLPLLCYLKILNILAIRKIINIARKFNANLIHTNIGALQIGYVAAKRIGIPHVWHIREYQGGILNMKPFPSLSKLKGKINSSYSIAISQGIYDYYSMSRNAKVIYDGVLKSKQTQFIKEKSKYFLFVGQVQESKGIEQLIDAFIQFKKLNKEYELYIAGWGKEFYISILKSRIEDAGINQQVHFLGPRKDVFDLMAKSSAVIVSSFSEGFGFVAAEAMFNGSLVIGYNDTGTKEQFDNGFRMHNNEIALRYSNHSELVNAMKEVVKNGVEYYFPMIMRAQETARSLYSQERHVTSVLNFYNEILDN